MSVRDEVGNVADTFETVEIQTDPKEIMDRVDDMLAWLRIASTAETYFNAGAYRRAEPYIAIGPGQVGLMSPCGVTSWVRKEERARSVRTTEDDIDSAVSLFDMLMKNLGERPCMATLTESASDSQAGFLRECGDNVDDRVDIENDDNRYSFYRDVQYHLEGAWLLSPSEAASYRRTYGLPQVARVLAYQNHAVFKDGRTSAGTFAFGYTDDAGLIDLKTRARVKARLDSPRPSASGLIADRLINLISCQFLRRDLWTVEVAAAPDRTGIGLSTDAIGAQAIVADLRDKSDDPKRMVHWVAEHMRKRRGGGDPAVVRAHLRGKQAFRVGRYWATVYPSRGDIERACNGARFDLAAREVRQ